jgi:hypothetical protein
MEFISEAPLRPTIVPEEKIERFVNEIANTVLAHDWK